VLALTGLWQQAAAAGRVRQVLRQQEMNPARHLRLALPDVQSRQRQCRAVVIINVSNIAGFEGQQLLPPALPASSSSPPVGSWLSSETPVSLSYDNPLPSLTDTFVMLVM